MMDQGNLDKAAEHFRMALDLYPDYAEAHENLANVLGRKGEVVEAIAHYRKALEIQPNKAEAHNNLGILLAQRGEAAEAIAQFRKAVDLRSDDAIARKNLGLALSRQNDLAWVMATASDASLRDGAKAVALAEQAKDLTGGGDATILRTLAAAYAEAGRYAEAAAMARQALNQAQAQSNKALAGALQEEIKLYEAGRPMRETK